MATLLCPVYHVWGCVGGSFSQLQLPRVTLELKESLLCVFVLKGSRENGGSEGGGRGNDSGPDGRVWCQKQENRGGAQHEEGGVKPRGWVKGGVQGLLTCAPLVYERCNCSKGKFINIILIFLFLYKTHHGHLQQALNQNIFLRSY